MIGWENEKNRMCIKAFRQYMTMDLIGTLERIEQFLQSGNGSFSDDSNIIPDSDTSPPSDGESDPSDKAQSRHPSQIALRKARKQRRRERDLLLMRQHRKPEGGHAAFPMRKRVADIRREEFRPEETSHYSRSDHHKSREAIHKPVRIPALDEAIEEASERRRMSRKD